MADPNIASEYDPKVAPAAYSVDQNDFGIAHNAILINFSSSIVSGTPGVAYNNPGDFGFYRDGSFLAPISLFDVDSLSSGILMNPTSSMFGPGWINGTSTTNHFIDEFVFTRQARKAEAGTGYTNIEFHFSGVHPGATYEFKTAGYYETAVPIFQCLRASNSPITGLNSGQLAGPGEVVSSGVRDDGNGNIISDWNRSTVAGGMQSGSTLTIQATGTDLFVNIEALSDVSNLFTVAAGMQIRKIYA